MFNQAVCELQIKYTLTELREALFSLSKIPGKKIRLPSDIREALDPYAAEEQEYFLVMTLNGAHEVIQVHEVSKGLVNRTLMHPREIFRPAILDNSASIVIAHNHPSGNVEPSPEDREVTEMIEKASKIVGIKLLDHVIIGRFGFYSFQENGYL